MTSTTTGSVITHDRFYIDGQWLKPRGSGRITVISPNTAEMIGDVPEGVPADIDAAVTAARRAFDDPRGWSTLAPTERAAHIHRFADEIDRRKDEFATLVSSQNGMPISLAGEMEAVFPSVLLRYYADMAASAARRRTRGHVRGDRRRCAGTRSAWSARSSRGTSRRPSLPSSTPRHSPRDALSSSSPHRRPCSTRSC